MISVYKKVNKLNKKLGKLNQEIDGYIIYRGFKMSQPKHHLKVNKTQFLPFPVNP